MQDPNLDTEWNDVLRQKGILAPKEKEITEEQIIDIVERTVQEKLNKSKYEDKTLDELDEFEDEEDERILNEYRRKRIEEMKAFQSKAKYGDIYEITAVDYVQEVNKAGEGVWVVLHLYKQGIPLCNIINEHLKVLARKFPATKFIKSISTTCVPNYPDKNLPTIFVYYEGELKSQLVGPLEFKNGLNLRLEDIEIKLHSLGAVKSNLNIDDYNENSKRLTAYENEMIKTIREGIVKKVDDEDDD